MEIVTLRLPIVKAAAESRPTRRMHASVCLVAGDRCAPQPGSADFDAGQPGALEEAGKRTGIAEGKTSPFI